MRFQETESVELIKTFNDTIETDIVAFLNSHQGSIYIGVDDNGTIVGVDNVDVVMRNIADIITTKILPNPQEYVETKAIFEQGKMIVVVEVKQGSALYYIKKYGRSPSGCYIRIGTSCRSMTEEQIEKGYISSINISAKSIVNIPNYNQDLTFAVLKTNLITKGFHINDLSFYKNYSLVDENGKFNLLANLFADTNDVSIIIARFEGLNKNKLIEKTEYGFVSIIASINRMIDRLEAINITKSVIGVPYRLDKRLLDKKCLREAFINAIAHNDWVDGTPPAVYVFKDRIEIISTGGLPKDLSMNEFYLGISKPRNKELMRILGDLEYVEHTGYGIPKIVEIYGKDVFQITENFIRVVLPFDKDVLEEQYQEDSTVNSTVKLNETQKAVIQLLEENDSITIDEIANRMNKTTSTIKKSIKYLKDNKMISREGSDKSGKWIMKME